MGQDAVIELASANLRRNRGAVVVISTAPNLGRGGGFPPTDLRAQLLERQLAISLEHELQTGKLRS